MMEFDRTTFDTVVQHFDQRSENDIDKEQYAVVVHPPQESNKDPRDIAERLYSDLHGHGSISYEIPSDGENVALQIVVDDRATAETVARHVQVQLGAETEIETATMPIERDDTIAAATFGYDRDTIFPLTTTRTDDSDVGTLHHILDTMAADDVRGCYQVCLEPIEEDWMTRRSRGLPASIEEERDVEAEAKRAGVALLPTVVLSFWLSPWPLATSLVVALGLLVAISIGDGVRVPQVRDGEELAREVRETATLEHGASSTTAKKAKATADVITEQAHAPGWRLALRLVVAGDSTIDAVGHRDRLVTQIKRSLSSDVTRQGLTATTATGEKAKQILERMRDREIERDSMERLHRLLAHNTRTEMRAGPAGVSSLGNFPDRNGGGEEAREFVRSTSMETTAVAESVPAYSRDNDREALDLDFDISPDANVEYRHQNFETVETNVIEETEGTDDDNHFAGAFGRELIESKREQPKDALYLGHVEEDQQTREIGVPFGNLDRHIFVTGASGNGKSTLLKSICCQHAWAGRGFAIADPHNEFIEELLEVIPDHRKDDIIYIDPAGPHDSVVALNPLDVQAEPGSRQYEEVVNGRIWDIIGVLKVSGRMGNKMIPNAKTLLRGMIMSPKDYTLVDMHEMLVEPAKRESFADRMEAEGQIVAKSARKIAEMDNGDLDALARRLHDWVHSPTCRRIIDNEKAAISWDKAVKENKIILVKNKLADGAMQQLLATLVVQGVWRAAISRPKDDRPLYPIMVDEVDNILTPELDMGTKLADGRKFGVSLTLLTQFPSRIDSIKKDVGNNCKTFVSFELPWPDESRPVADLFECSPSQIQDIAKFHAMVQIETAEEKSGPHVMQTFPDYPAIRTEEEAEVEIVVPALDRDGTEIVEGWTGEPTERETMPIEAEKPDILDRFLDEVQVAAREGQIEENTHYRIVHKGKSNEEMRINASRVVEAMDFDWIDDPGEVTSRAKELVDDEASSVTAHSKPSGSINRAIGIDTAKAEIEI